MSLKSINYLDTLYDRLFQAQVEHRWKDADEVQKEIRRLEDWEENNQESIRNIDVC